MSEQRLIDANALKKYMGCADAVKYGNKNAEQQHRSYSTLMMYEIADYIDDAPTIEAEPVRHGRWVNGILGTKCSCCGVSIPIVWYKDEEGQEHCIEIEKTPRCPHCGAKMDGGK